MFSTKSLLAATAAFSLIASSTAVNNNVAVYWGQGANQQRLRTFCDETSIDIIPIGFLTLFPQQGNGLPVENFGNACWGDSVYQGPGNDHSKDGLFTRCPTLQEDIPYCQAKGKKIILSLGGATQDYQLTTVTAGRNFANQLWDMYGHKDPAYTGIRPLDRGLFNTSSETIDIDGFDLDIEHPSIDSSAGYIELVKQLRENFKKNPSKTYLITGAPQCPLPDASMSAMIAAVKFDILWIQFYNNGGYGCNARNWANDNPNYATTKQETNKVNLNYNAWKSHISSGESKDAQIYIGLIGASAGTCQSSAYGDYINALEAHNLITAYQSDSQFGGVMLWDATTAINNACNCGRPYYDTIKGSLNGIKPQGADCAPITSSTTSHSTTSTLSSTSTSTTPTLTTSTTSSSSSLTSSLTSTDVSATSSVPTSESSSTTSSVISTLSSDTSSTTVITDPTLSLPTGSATETTSTSSSSLPTRPTSDTTSGSSGPTTTLSGTETSVPSSTGSVELTTSTVYTTSVSTITSCPPTVTNCPVGSVVTSTIALYTTICPVSEANGGKPTPPPSPPSPPIEYTTSTVYTTRISIVTACPPSVKSCPGRDSVTTEIIPLYTTVCPVGNNASPTPNPKPTTISTQTISFSTVRVSVAAIPTPEAPYPKPSGSKHSGHSSGSGVGTIYIPKPSGTGAPITVVEVSPVPKAPTIIGGNKAIETPSAPAPVPVKPSTTPIQASSANKMGGSAFIIGVVALMGAFVL